MVAQHVHHANSGERYAGKVGSLGHGRTDQQTAVRSPGNGQTTRLGVALIDEVFACCNEVVKYVLLLEQHARFVPFFPKFTSAAQVGHGINAVVFQEQQQGRAETRGQADVKTAVRIEVRWSVTVERESFFVDNEHRHRGAVLGFVPDLLRFEVFGVEINFRCSKQRAFTRGHIVAVNGSGVGK